MTDSGIFSPDQLASSPSQAVPMAAVAPPPPPPRLRRPERDQVVLRPVSLEEMLPPEHPARVVWAAV